MRVTPVLVRSLANPSEDDIIEAVQNDRYLAKTLGSMRTNSKLQYDRDEDGAQESVLIVDYGTCPTLTGAQTRYRT